MGGVCASCATDSASSPPTPEESLLGKLKEPGSVKRPEYAYYNVNFSTRPLNITLNSDKDSVDAYITFVDEDCPIEENENIIINSKIISINGRRVEGKKLDKIAQLLWLKKLPLRITLVGPEDLRSYEVPASNLMREEVL